MSRRWALPIALLAVVLGLVGGPATPASAHPLGNFTINTYSGLRIGGDHISVDFLVDMAEIPALQRTRESDEPGYAGRECERQAGRLDLRLDDRRVELGVQASDVTFPEGQGGLRTLRLTCTLSGPIGLRGDSTVVFSSSSFSDRAGWREITAEGDGTTLVSSDVPVVSLSGRLTSYPEDLLSSPLDQRSATVVARPGGPVGAIDPAGAGDAVRTTPLPGSVDRVTRAFTALVTHQDLTVGVALLALLASVVLGAIHAFAPGHGKTVMAAYLVGQRGSLRQASLIALTVTATHTGGVLALGLVISASSVVAPERLYPWLGAVTGVLLALVGGSILLRIARGRRRGGHRHRHHDHDHGHGRTHSHGGVAHSHGPVGLDDRATRRSLVAMGFVGGLLPSPSAVVVLLGAIALGRAWFGVLLVLMYGVGMAATLTGAGLLLVRARGVLDARVARLETNRALVLATAMLPALTAGFIVAVGLFLAARGVTQI